MQNVCDKAKRCSDKNDQQKDENSGDVPIIPRQNILDELENSGRHLHTNGNVQCIMENSQNYILGASIHSVSGTCSGSGNVRIGIDEKHNSGICRERIANECEECCQRREEQDANTVVNGNTGPDFVTSCHGDKCLHEVMEHRQGYEISNDLMLDSKEVFVQNDNQISEQLEEKGTENTSQNVSSSHSERDETIRAENVANDLDNDLEVTVKVTSIGPKGQSLDNFDYIFKLVDSAVDEALKEMHQQQQGRAVLVTKTTREEDTEISSQKTAKMERKPSETDRIQVQLKTLPVASSATPKAAGASSVRTDVKRVSAEAPRGPTTSATSTSTTVKEFKSFHQQQQQKETTVTKATNSVTTVTKGPGSGGKTASQSSTTSFSSVSVQRSETQPPLVRTWDNRNKDQKAETTPALKARIVPFAIEKKRLQPEVSEAKAISTEVGAIKVTPDETKQQLKNLISNNNKASIVTKRNKDDTTKTEGGLKEKPKQDHLLNNKMDEQENSKDEKVAPISVEDKQKDKETELNDSADSVVKVNSVVAKVDVVTKETRPESVTDKKVEKARETTENKTVDTESKDKVMENNKAMDNRGKSKEAKELKTPEQESNVKINAVINRNPAVIDHVSDDVTETQLLLHQRPLVSTTLLDPSHSNLTLPAHPSLDILAPLLLHVDDIDDDESDDDDDDEEDSVRNMESFAESDIPLYSSIYSSAVSKIMSS